MKTIFISLAIILSINSYSQVFHYPTPNNESKPEYKFIIIWRTWGSGMVQHGDLMGMEYKWNINMRGFYSQDEVTNWLNSGQGYDGKPTVTISADQLIGVYDLTKSAKLEVELKTENKSLPKRVEIEEEKWTEQHYELK